MRVIRRTSIHQLAGVALIFASLLHSPASAATLSLQTATGDTLLFLGDTVEFYVNINPRGEVLHGFEFFLTFDPEIFEIIFQEHPGDDLRPFYNGNVFPAPAPPSSQGTHGDTVGYDPMHNLIPGFQLDYTQQIGPNGIPFNGLGLAAGFKLAVIGLPRGANPTTTITIDDHTQSHRKTGYWAQATYTQKSQFQPAPGALELGIAGVAINPAIPDTVLTPGDDMSIHLADHYSSGLYPEPTAIWTMNTVLVPGGVTAALDTVNDADSIYIASIAGSQGLLSLAVNVESPDAQFSDLQFVNIIVDHAPTFNVPLPDFNFDEDTQQGLVVSELFTDQDDAGTNLTIWLEPDAYVHLTHNPSNDSVTFYADTNWAGSHQARLHVRDALGVSADTLLSISVNPVNDPPSIDISAIGEPGDTLIIHHGEQMSRILNNYVQDVDDVVSAITWSLAFLNPPDTTNLNATLIGSVLGVETTGNGFYGDIALELTATDDEAASDSDTLIVSIRSWPPVIGNLTDIIVLAGVQKDVPMGAFVSDNDTPDSLMTWTFEAVDYVTGAVDDSVDVSNFDAATQTLTIYSQPDYNGVDWLRMTVEDDDNNTDYDSTRLGVFASLNPIILPFPTDTVLSNRLISPLLDLDAYVIDPVDTPEELTWTFSGGTRLLQVIIDAATHVVSVRTDPSFFGKDTITFTAKNSADSTASGDMVLVIVPETNGPPIWDSFDLVEIVYPDTTTIFNLATGVSDDFTPSDQLDISYTVNPDPFRPLQVIIDTVTLDVSVTSDQQTLYDTWVYFTAVDDQGLSSISDTIFVSVTDYYSPVWGYIPLIKFHTGQTWTDTLNRYLSDRDTPVDSLTINVIKNISSLYVQYDTATTVLALSSQPKRAEGYLYLYATDPQGKVGTAAAKVEVEILIDNESPEGNLSYYFNPVADHWITYVVVSDSTATELKSTYTKDTRIEPLQFYQQDDLSGEFNWSATKEFVSGGTYELNVVLLDASSNPTELKLPITINLSKALGGLFTSPDGNLTAYYPGASISEGYLIALSEHELDPSSGEIASSMKLPKGAGAAPRYYSLDSNLPEDLVVTVSRTIDDASGNYYSFYQLSGDRLSPITTYTEGNSRFNAEIRLGTDFLFKDSDIEAATSIIPYNQLLLYPNPFNADLQVKFLLRTPEQGTVKIYNLLGREIYSTPNKLWAAGTNAFIWSGVDNRGRLVPSGVYFLRLATLSGTLETRKVTLLK